MMDDRKSENKSGSELESLVEAMKTQHNKPPETPRDKMWERIDAARAESRGNDGAQIVRPDFQAGQWFQSARFRQAAVAVAAVLVLGIAIGRNIPRNGDLPSPVAVIQTMDQTTGSVVASVKTTSPSTGNLLYEKAATDLFDRADALLTDFKVTPCTDQDLNTIPHWADGMLLQTRLLMGTPVAVDPEMNDLLLDLELVLAQIVGLNQDNCARDVAWIRDAMAEKSTIDRLRQLKPNKLTRDAI